VKWVVSTCKQCEFCLNGTDELHCPKQLNSGFSTAGTFQEYCLTDGRYATRYYGSQCYYMSMMLTQLQAS
jgi:propanol-preferring alcohol dehydrogenase